MVQPRNGERRKNVGAEDRWIRMELQQESGFIDRIGLADARAPQLPHTRLTKALTVRPGREPSCHPQVDYIRLQRFFYSETGT